MYIQCMGALDMMSVNILFYVHSSVKHDDEKIVHLEDMYSALHCSV